MAFLEEGRSERGLSDPADAWQSTAALRVTSGSLEANAKIGLQRLISKLNGAA